MMKKSKNLKLFYNNYWRYGINETKKTLNQKNLNQQFNVILL